MKNPDARPVSFYIVDVFAREPLTGNPLAVVPDADGLDENVMKRIAREFNQSETTFVLSPTRPGADWRLRSFTASGTEVFGAGHNALGAWWWLAEAGRLPLDTRGNTFMQEIGERVLPVEIVRDAERLVAISMTHAPPSFGAVQEDGAELKAALRLGEDDLLTGPLPAQVVSTGAAHLLVPVRDRAAVERARPDSERLALLLRAVGGQGCYVFCLDPIERDGTAYARFFNPTVGISEDPATGSAAGPLACYLTRHGVVQEGAAVVIEQGHAMGRPSRIDVRVRDDDVESQALRSSWPKVLFGCRRRFVNRDEEYLQVEHENAGRTSELSHHAVRSMVASGRPNTEIMTKSIRLVDIRAPGG